MNPSETVVKLLVVVAVVALLGILALLFSARAGQVYNDAPAAEQEQELISGVVDELMLGAEVPNAPAGCVGRVAGVIVAALSDGVEPGAGSAYDALTSVELQYVSEAGSFEALEARWATQNGYDVSALDVINEAQSVCTVVYG